MQTKEKNFEQDRLTTYTPLSSLIATYNSQITENLQKF